MSGPQEPDPNQAWAPPRSEAAGHGAEQPPVPQDQPPAPQDQPPAPHEQPPAPQGQPTAPQGQPPWPQGQPPAPQGQQPAPHEQQPAPQGWQQPAYTPQQYPSYQPPSYQHYPPSEQFGQPPQYAQPGQYPPPGQYGAQPDYGQPPGQHGQPGQYGQFAPYPPPPGLEQRPKRSRTVLGAVIAGLAVLIIAAVAVLGFWEPGFFVTTKLDVNKAQTGVQQILTDETNGYGAKNVKDVRCNNGQNPTVKKGDAFNCQVSIDGTMRQVTVTFQDDKGTYEVGRPK